MVGAARTAQPAVEAQHPITAATHHVEIVRDLQDRPALAAAQIKQQVVELLRRLGIQAGLGQLPIPVTAKGGGVQGGGKPPGTASLSPGIRGATALREWAFRGAPVNRPLQIR